MKTFVTFVEGMDATPIKVWNKALRVHTLAEIEKLTDGFRNNLEVIIHRLTAAPHGPHDAKPELVPIERITFSFGITGTGIKNHYRQWLRVIHNQQTIATIELGERPCSRY